MHSLQTERLKIAFDMVGEPEAFPVLLLHGWPDAAESWAAVASQLQEHGYRTVVPSLRGSYPTEFLSEETPRFAGAVAMAQDAIDLMNGLGIGRFAVVGHDWGARVAYTLATLFPERVACVTALALAYQPGGRFRLGDFTQSRHFWYQFFQCTPAGVEAVRRDPVGFAREQWETWSPKGWFAEEAFNEASRYFAHPDWAEITLNAYRSRYLAGEVRDPAYAALQAVLEQTETIGVPTVMIHGAADTCDLPSGSEGKERFFKGSYSRLVLPGVGHFPHREAPQQVAEAVLRQLGTI